MTIEWNKVTWYSKTLAVIAFVGVFFLGYWLGTQKIEGVYLEIPKTTQDTTQSPNPLNTDAAGATYTNTLLEGASINSTSTWQTYTNSKYKFQINYPDSWKPLEYDSIGFERKEFNGIPGTDGGPITLSISVSTTTNTNLTNWFKDEYSDRGDHLSIAKKITISGLDALSYNDMFSGGGCTNTYLVLKDKVVFTMYRYGATCDIPDSIFEEVVSSFKFI